MPRPPKRENERHPLKILRAIVSPDRDTPLSQPAFAKLIGATPNTIKMTEAGQRKVGASLHSKIKVAVGAQWNETTRTWEFAYKPNNVPGSIYFTPQLFLQYRRGIETPPAEKDRWIAGACWRLKLLLEHIPPDRWYPLLFRVWEALDEWRTEFDINPPMRWPDGLEETLQEYFDRTRPAFVLGFNEQTGDLEGFTAVSAQWPELRKPEFRGSVVEPIKRQRAKKEKGLGHAPKNEQ